MKASRDAGAGGTGLASSGEAPRLRQCVRLTPEYVAQRGSGCFDLLVRFAVIGLAVLVVAGGAWADGGPTRTAPPPGSVQLGQQTKTTGCLLGPIPDLGCSPGVMIGASGYTRSLCGVTSGPLPSSLPRMAKERVGAAYGLPASTEYGPRHAWEIVPVVPYVLGGAFDENLGDNYPIPSKDLQARARLVRVLANEANCAPWKLTWLQAAHEMFDWVAAYVLVFGKQP